MKINRRELLRKAGFFSGYFVVAAASQPFISSFATAQPGVFRFPQVEPRFPQGVGSADPQPDAVLVWTRAIPQRDGDYGDDQPVILQMSKDDTFAEVVLERSMTATEATDYSIRAVVKGLEPDTTYYYRFIIDDANMSRVGRTWTAPAKGTRRPTHVMLASCQSWPPKKMGAYRNFLTSQERGDNPRVDFILHVGDYIYETDYTGPEPLIPINGNETDFDRRLSVYRQFYRGYLQDPDLQLTRALYPFICIWDDHEYVNDAWQSGGVRGTPDQPRRLAATRAWFEFVPQILDESPDFYGIQNPAHDYRQPDGIERTRRFEDFDQEFFSQEPNNLKAIQAMTIYRTVQFGDMVDLIVPDERSYRGPSGNPGWSLNNIITGNSEVSAFSGMELFDGKLLRTLADGRAANGGNPPAMVETPAGMVENPRINDPQVTMLGSKQKTWFKNALKASQARWRVLANSVPMMGFTLNPGDLNPELANGYKWTDAWDGYPNERAELMQYIKDEGITNTVSLTGDRHAHYAGLVAIDYEEDKPEYVIPEFVCTAISAFPRSGDIANALGSYGLEHLAEYAMPAWDGTPEIVANCNVLMRHGAHAAQVMYETNDREKMLEAANPDVNPHLEYADNDAHGYVLAHFYDNYMNVDFVAVPRREWNPEIHPIGPPARRKVGFRTDAWRAGERPAVVATYAEGEPNFGDG